jgi:hypothetical protein
MNNPISRQRLLEILESHKRWLAGYRGGERANLYGANLYEADLTRAILDRADLTMATLAGANLDGANIYGASLYEANLTGADLTGANLNHAALTGANLTRAVLISADLTGATLAGAVLDGATLEGAKLDNAKLEKLDFFPIPQKSKFLFAASRTELSIGCKRKTWEEWRRWFEGEEEYETKRGSVDFMIIQESFIYAEKIWPFILEKYPNLGTESIND